MLFCRCIIKIKIFYSITKRKKMNTENKFHDARAAMKDLAKKVETIDLSGSGLVGGKKRRAVAKKGAKKRSVSRKRSTSAKKATKARSSSRKRSTSAKRVTKRKSSSASKKVGMSLNEHKLADNLI